MEPGGLSATTGAREAANQVSRPLSPWRPRQHVSERPTDSDSHVRGAQDYATPPAPPPPSICPTSSLHCVNRAGSCYTGSEAANELLPSIRPPGRMRRLYVTGERRSAEEKQ